MWKIKTEKVAQLNNTVPIYVTFTREKFAEKETATEIPPPY
jgi:hypothetical protein